MIRGIRLCAELYIAFFVAIEDVGGGTESRENLAELVVLVGLVEASSDLVHRWHGTTRSHVNPEGREESKNTTLKILGVHHDVHLVLGVARVNCVSKAAVVVVPLHHEGTTSEVLSVLIGRPRLGGPSM